MPHFIRRLALAAVTIALGTLAVVSCSSQATGYEPAAYGAAGQCYYMQSPAEAVALEAAGLCPAGWVPTMAPLSWQLMYWPYYSSPAYYSVYVPSSLRTSYVTVEQTTYKTHAAQITTAERSATYKTAGGKTVKGTQVTAKTTFGAGKSFGAAGTKYGGGSARASTTTVRGVSNPDNSGHSVTRTSFGGGSARAGGHR